MTRFVDCKKLHRHLEGLQRAPYPGPLGEKIFTEISKEAWGQWLEKQTILINENRLNVLEPEAREFLKTEMQKFLFDV